MSLIGRNNQAQYYQLGGEPLDIIKPMNMEYGLMAQPKNDPLTFKKKEVEVGTTGNTIQYNNSLAQINQQKNQAVRLLQQRYSQYGKTALDPNDKNFEETSKIISVIQQLTEQENQLVNFKGQFDNNYKTVSKDQEKIASTPGLGEKVGQTARGIYVQTEKGVTPVQLKDLWSSFQYNLQQGKQVPIVNSNQLLNNSQVIAEEDSLPLTLNGKEPIKVESIYNFDDKTFTNNILNKFEGQISTSSGTKQSSSNGSSKVYYAFNSNNSNNIAQLTKTIFSLDKGLFDDDTEKWMQNQFLNYMNNNGSIKLLTYKTESDGLSMNIIPSLDDKGKEQYVSNIADPRAYQSFKALKLAEIYNIKIDSRKGSSIGSMTSTDDGSTKQKEDVIYDEIQSIMLNPSIGDKVDWNTVDNKYRPDVFMEGISKISNYFSKATNSTIENYVNKYKEYQQSITEGNTDKAKKLLVETNNEFMKVIYRLETEVSSSKLDNAIKKKVIDFLKETSGIVENYGATIAKGVNAVPVGQSNMIARINPLNEMVEGYTGIMVPKAYTALGSEINNKTILFSTHVISDVVKYDASTQMTDNKGVPIRRTFADAKLTERAYFNHLQLTDEEWRSKNTASYVVSWTAIHASEYKTQKFKVSNPKNPNEIITVTGEQLDKDKNLKKRAFAENNIYDNIEEYWGVYASKHQTVFNSKEEFIKSYEGQIFIPIYHDYISRGSSQTKGNKTQYKRYNSNN